MPKPILPGFLRERHAHRDGLTFELHVVDICDGNLIEGLIVSTILAKFEQLLVLGTSPLPPGFVARDGHIWARTPWDWWWRSARIPKRTGIRHMQSLEKRGYVACQTFLDRGSATGRALHVRVTETFIEQWKKALNSEPPLFMERD